MWIAVSRKSIFAYGVSALLVIAIACGGTANSDATASPAQAQSSQAPITTDQSTPDSTRVGLSAPSEQVTVPTTDAQQQATEPVSATASAPITPSDTKIVPSQPEPSEGVNQSGATATTQVPAIEPTQAVAPNGNSEPASTTEVPVSAPSAQVDPAPVTLPAPPAQVAPVVELDAAAIVAAQEKVFTDLYVATLPSTVHIRVDRAVQGGFQSAGEGSGFVWDANGVIVTNNHVVDGSDRVWVNFEDGNVFLAQIIGNDPYSDLAALQIDAPAGYLSPVSLGDNDDLKVGQFTFAWGTLSGRPLP